jgi:hypothetical protein
MKKTRLLPILLSVVLVLSVLPFPTLLPVARAADEIPEGYTPVYTIEDLYAVRNVRDGNYILMNDLDLTEALAPGGDWDSGYGWRPICDDSSFTGVFDGNGHTISGLRISGNTTSNKAGLFGGIGGTIKDLRLTAVDIDSSNAYTGAICGYASGVISNVHVSGKIKSAGGYTGGISGSVSAILISNVSVSGEIESSGAYTGGLVGYTSGGTQIELSCNMAEITGGANAGGIVGCSFDGPNNNLNITQTYNKGNVNGTSHTGGILGFIEGYTYDSGYSTAPQSTSIVNNCYNVGEVTGGRAGGIIGYNQPYIYRHQDTPSRYSFYYYYANPT